MIRMLVGWLGAAVLGVLALAATVVVGFSVPKPPAITTEDVTRVSWRPIVKNADLLIRGIRSRSIATWMPDGERLLVGANHLVFDNRLHLQSAAGADPELLSQIPRNVGTIASDLGREYIVFSWDENGAEQFQLYRWDLGDSDPVRLTNGEERSAFGAFEPGGDRFAFVTNRRNGTDMDVYIGNPEAPGSEEMVFEASGMWGVADWSPDGDALLLIHVASNVENEIYLFDVESQKATLVSKGDADPIAHGSAQFASDGSALYLVSDRDSEFKQLRRLDLATGTETVLTDEISWDVEGARESGDGSFLVLSVNEDGQSRTYVYDVAGDDLELLDLFPSGLMNVRLHPDRPLLAVNHVDGFGVSRGYLYDVPTKRLTLWTGDEPPETRTEVGRLIRYPTFDEVDGERRLISAFVYPGEGEGPRPVLINIHGGPEAQARLTHGHLRSQRAGFTVIAPNVRGSTGYGKGFTKLDDGVLREDAVKDIGALLDWIDTRPELDGRRVAVAGGSYGGYMVLASLVHFGDRIRCGVDVVGVSNFVTFLENTAPYRRDLRRAEYGDERDPEMREFLESISPLNNAERIVSPLMVVQGANDPRVPVNESRQMVERVRGNEQQVSYIEAADEGHGFRKPWNSLYAQAAQAQMLEGCLGR